MLHKPGTFCRSGSPSPARQRSYSRNERGDTNTDNSLSEKALSITRTCAEALRLASGVVPGCGSQIQALLDLGLVLLDRIEQIRAWKGVKKELRRKVDFVLDMTGTTLQQPCMKHASGLERDLLEVKKILQEIGQFVNRRTDSKGRKILRIVTCKSDYDKVSAFGAQIDEAVRNLSVKSLIQMRLDIGCLKATVQTSAEEAETNLRVSIKSSTEKLQEEFRSSTKRVTEILNYLSERLPRPEAAINRTASAENSDMPDTNANLCSACPQVAHDCRGLGSRVTSGGGERWNSPILGRRTTMDEEPGGILISHAVVYGPRLHTFSRRYDVGFDGLSSCSTVRLFALGHKQDVLRPLNLIRVSPDGRFKVPYEYPIHPSFSPFRHSHTPQYSAQNSIGCILLMRPIRDFGQMPLSGYIDHLDEWRRLWTCS